MLSAQVINSLTVRLTWTKPADGGSPITTYWIYRGYSSGTEGQITLVGCSPLNLTCDDTTVAPGTTYYYYVRAVNAIGVGAKSNTMPVTP